MGRILSSSTLARVDTQNAWSRTVAAGRQKKTPQPSHAAIKTRSNRVRLTTTNLPQQFCAVPARFYRSVKNDGGEVWRQPARRTYEEKAGQRGPRLSRTSTTATPGDNLDHSTHAAPAEAQETTSTTSSAIATAEGQSTTLPISVKREKDPSIPASVEPGGIAWDYTNTGLIAVLGMVFMFVAFLEWTAGSESTAFVCTATAMALTGSRRDMDMRSTPESTTNQIKPTLNRTTRSLYRRIWRSTRVG